MMGEYLTFLDNGDKEYTNPDSIDRDQIDKEFARLGTGAQVGLWFRNKKADAKDAFKKATAGSGIVKGAKVKVDKADIAKNKKKNAKELKAELAKSSSDHTQRRKANDNIISERAKKASKEKAEKELANKMSRDRKSNTLNKLRIGQNEDDRRIARNKLARDTWAKNKVHEKMKSVRSSGTAIGAVGGGALGLGAGHLASKSSRKELASLSSKGIKSESDRKRADELRKRIKRKKFAGAAIGAVSGAIVGRNIGANKGISKGKKEVVSAIRSGSGGYSKEKTSRNSF